MSDAYSLNPTPVASLGVNDRAAFIMRTYQHLLGAILAFTAFEVFLFETGLAVRIAEVLLSGSWLLVLGAFMIVGWLANSMAHRAESLGAQYAGLLFLVVAWAIIFVPMLVLAESYAPGTIKSAATATLLGFIGLTAIAFHTRKDFSFMGGLLRWIGLIAIGLIVASALFSFTLGTWFSVAMIAFAGAAILYDTSNVLHHFPRDRYVAASMALFASVALLFWYVLQLFMSRD